MSPTRPPTRAETSQYVGQALKAAWRAAAAEDGVQAAARRLRRLRGFSADPALTLRVLGIVPTLGMPAGVVQELERQLNRPGTDRATCRPRRD